jgi:hypothetical protein
MNADIRARWTAALRSGDYQQAKGALRRDGDGRCCLGVLCDLAVADGIIEPPSYDDHDDVWEYTADGESLVLPAAVYRWAGINTRQDELSRENALANPIVTVDDDGGSLEARALATLNDDGWTFPQIADAIDGGAH